MSANDESELLTFPKRKERRSLRKKALKPKRVRDK
jgi:hypothetical protein